MWGGGGGACVWGGGGTWGICEQKPHTGTDTPRLPLLPYHCTLEKEAHRAWM